VGELIGVVLPASVAAGKLASKLGRSGKVVNPKTRPVRIGKKGVGKGSEGQKGGIVGRSFGKLGIVVQKPHLSISDVSIHRLNQSITRGVSSSTILEPFVVLPLLRGKVEEIICI
jgi:hypothetical protein